MRLAEHLRLVRAQVDDAVGDHDIHALRGDGEVLDQPLAKLDGPRVAGVDRVGAGALEHLGRHVDADEAAFRAELLGGEQGVESRSGAQVDDGFAWFQASERRGVPAAKPEIRVGRGAGDVLLRVANQSSGFGVGVGRGAAAAARSLLRGRPAAAASLSRDLGVSRLHDVMYLIFFHQSLR